MAKSTSANTSNLDDLSPDQREVYIAVARWLKAPKGVLSVGGFAGCGKTFLLAKLVREHPDIRMVCCAYTGKAANVLASKIGAGNPHVEIMTLHRLLYQPIEKEDRVSFMRKASMHDRNQSNTIKVIVVDEASMVSDQILDDILAHNRPVLAIGDHGQLPPVAGHGSLMAKPDLRLEKIHRQAEGDPILQAAAYVRERGRFPKPLPDGVRHMIWRPFVDEIEGLVRIARELGVEGTRTLFDTAVLSYTNDARATSNKIVRAARWTPAQIAEGVQVGDVVICLRNDYTHKIFNGMRGIVESVRRGTAEESFDGINVRFPDNQDWIFSGRVVRKQFGRATTFQNVEELKQAGVEVPPFATSMNDLGACFFDFGYAMTVHKSQGSQFERVYLTLEWPKQVSADNFRRFCYTGTTRASKQLTLIERR